MIEYTINIEENDGKVAIKVDTKESDNVTASENRDAELFSKAIRMSLAKIGLRTGEVHLVEQGNDGVAQLIGGVREAIAKAKSDQAPTPLPANLPTIKQQWDRYLAMCYPTGVSAMQREEMEGVFYCGFFASLCTMTAAAKLSDDDGAKALEILMAEADAFQMRRLLELRARENAE